MEKHRFDEYLGPIKWKHFVEQWYDYHIMLDLTKLKGCTPAAKLIALQVMK